VRAEILSDVDALDAIADEWDALAVELGRPLAAPAWQIAWWRNAAPPSAALAVVAVRSGDALAGIAPFFVEPYGGLTRARLTAAGVSVRNDILARRGAGPDVASAIAETFQAGPVRPDLVSLEGVYGRPAWARALASTWVRADAYPEWQMPGPVLSMDGRTYDGWFASRSRNFRQQMRRDRRRVEQAGGRFRMTTTAEELRRDLAAFARLHRARWEDRGGSATLSEAIVAMLIETAERQNLPERFQLWSLEIDGEIVSSHLFLAAGGEVSYWLGGFDERWSHVRPSIQTILVALEHAWSQGARRMDLGPGGHAYKYRFAEGDEPAEWWNVVPAGPRRVRATAFALGRRARKEIGARIPGPVRERLRRIVRAA
jgi:CelD/BcsL family acetyltransferase involved in cellulose biosynthesis